MHLINRLTLIDYQFDTIDFNCTFFSSDLWNGKAWNVKAWKLWSSWNKWNHLEPNRAGIRIKLAKMTHISKPLSIFFYLAFEFILFLAFCNFWKTCFRKIIYLNCFWNAGIWSQYEKNEFTTSCCVAFSTQQFA